MTDTVGINIAYGCCWTLAFRNRNLGEDVFVWVCVDRSEYDRRFAQLQKMEHVTVLQAGPSVVK